MAATLSRSRNIELREHIDATGGKVDRANGVIRAVKVLGQISKNGREYSNEAMADAARLYEGTTVHVDHPTRDNPGRERGLNESVGVLRNSIVRGDAVFADLHLVRSHPMFEQLCERAEKFPSNFGLSHNASGVTSRKNGREFVERIEHVRSVDIVGRPATNAGLFESAQGGGEAEFLRTASARQLRSWLRGRVHFVESGGGTRSETPESLGNHKPDDVPKFDSGKSRRAFLRGHLH
jgi:hypothetical protein